MSSASRDGALAERSRAPRSGPLVRQRAVRGRQRTGWLFIAPAGLFFVVFTLYPVLQMVWLALTASDGFGSARFVGLRNFVALASDRVFFQAVTNTFLYTVATTVLVTVSALVLALLIHHGPRRFQVVYRAIFFIPAPISLTVTGMLWRVGLNPSIGFVGELLRGAGLGGLVQPWLAEPGAALAAVVLVTLWQSCGLYMLVIYAGLGNIDPGIEESARIDGAGPLREVWDITIPMLRPVIGVVVMLNVIHGVKVFDLNYVMTNGGPLHATESLSTYTFLLTFGNSSGASSQFGYGAAISLVIFVVTALATVLQRRFRKEE